MNVREEFWRRLKEECLPAYCNDPKRRYSPEGFKLDVDLIGEYDAANFLRALDHKIVLDHGGGRYKAAQSKAYEYVFSEGERAMIPRPISVLPEPVITIGAVARLHLDFGWPVECLGIQSVEWAFDLMAFKPNDLTNEHVAGEVKATSTKLNKFLVNLNACCAATDHDCVDAKPDRINAHKKWLGLKRCRAPIFWAIGPGGDGRVFDVLYNKDGRIELKKVTEQTLRFS